MMQNNVIASILMKEKIISIFCVTRCYCIPYSAYFLRGGMFVDMEIFAASWKHFCG